MFTKNLGRVGFIKESLGTHGYFKANFDGKLTSQDVVAMSLYKRSWPEVSLPGISLIISIYIHSYGTILHLFNASFVLYVYIHTGENRQKKKLLFNLISLFHIIIHHAFLVNPVIPPSILLHTQMGKHRRNKKTQKSRHDPLSNNLTTSAAINAVRGFWQTV